MPRLYLPPPWPAGPLLPVDGERAHYLARVLRRRVGDPLVLFDGMGQRSHAHVESLDRHGCLLRIEPATAGLASHLDLQLVQAIGKGERMDLVVQKATELGTRAIHPVFSDHADVRPGDGSERRLQRWRQIAIHACEQSGRDDLPLLAEPAPLDVVLATPTAIAPATTTDAAIPLRIVLDPDGGDWPAPEPRVPAAVWIACGPEGGWSDAERDRFARAGYRRVGLGPRILRTETAPVVALAIAQYRWGDCAASPPPTSP